VWVLITQHITDAAVKHLHRSNSISIFLQVSKLNEELKCMLLILLTWLTIKTFLNLESSLHAV